MTASSSRVMTPSIPTETWAARRRSGSSSPMSRISPVPVTSRTPVTAPGQARVARARAVRGGRDRARDLLGVDVALVAQREAGAPERLVEVLDERAGERLRPLALRVGRDDPAHRGQVEQQPVGLDDRRERVGRGGHPHVGPAVGGGAHERGDLLLVARRGGVGRREGLVADPVRPPRRGGEVGEGDLGHAGDATARTTAARPRRTPRPPPRAPRPSTTRRCGGPGRRRRGRR